MTSNWFYSAGEKTAPDQKYRENIKEINFKYISCSGIESKVDPLFGPHTMDQNLIGISGKYLKKVINNIYIFLNIFIVLNTFSKRHEPGIFYCKMPNPKVCFILLVSDLLYLGAGKDKLV